MFGTVEVYSSFYHWPGAARFAGWAQRVPPGFSFAVKAPRGLTHARRLQRPEPWYERIAGSYRALGERAGALLLQLHPELERDGARLEYALATLPQGVRAAVEFRHPSWGADAVFALLKRYDAAYVVMSGAHLPCVLRRTASLVYVRFHGPDQDHLYAGSYSDADLDWWADRCAEWAGIGAEVLGYFNNDGHGHAVRNALGLRERLAARGVT